MILSKQQYDTFIGIMLGDACIPNERTKQSRLAFGQGESHQEYCEYIHKVFYPLSGKMSIRNDTRYDRLEFKFKSIIHPFFTEMRNKWYAYDNNIKKYVKIVPKDIEINWNVLAFWHADDGCNWQPKKFIRLSSQSFTKEDNFFLMSKLKKLNIKTTLNYNGISKNGYEKWVIRIGTKSYFDFIDGVTPFLKDIKCMNYKIDVSIAKTKPSIDTLQFNDKKIQEALKMVKQKYRKVDIYKKIGCSKSTLSKWIKKYC